MMLLSDCVAAYIDDCYGLSTATRGLYQWHLARFTAAVGDQPAGAVDVALVRTYMAGQRRQDGRPYSPAFLDQLYRTLHTFFEWCVQQG